MLAAALAAAALSAPQAQELLALDGADRLWRVDGYLTGVADGATASPLVQLAAPAVGRSVGLALTPGNGDLYLMTLVPPAGGGTSGAVVELRRFDLATGSGQLLHTWSSALFAAGLDALPDGRLVLTNDGRELWFVDPSSGARTILDAALPLASLSSVIGVALDERGALFANAADGTRRRLDPLDGAVLPLVQTTVFGGQSLEVDLDGAAYVGNINGSITRHRVGLAPLRILASNAVPGPVRALALRRPANEWAGDFVCDGTPNSTGRVGRLELLGTRFLAFDDLSLRARDLPAGATCAFIAGPVQGLRPVGAGFLCIDLPAVLVPPTLLTVDAQGTTRIDLPLTSSPVGGPLLPGDALYFQLWHRDAGPTVNFTGAVRTVFR